MDDEELRRRYAQRPSGMSINEWLRRLYLAHGSVGPAARAGGVSYQRVYNVVRPLGAEELLERSRRSLEEEKAAIDVQHEVHPVAQHTVESVTLRDVVRELQSIRELLERPHDGASAAEERCGHGAR